jgi:hypothetical protein
MVKKVTDSETLAMVRQTSHDDLKDDPTARTMTDLSWYGLLTPENLGRNGWRERSFADARGNRMKTWD